MLNIKIRVNCPEHSKIIQKHLFELGGDWYVNHLGGHQYLDSPFLYLNGGVITRSLEGDDAYFESQVNEEVNLKDLVNMVNKKCLPL